MPFHLVPLQAYVNGTEQHGLSGSRLYVRYILILKLKKLHQKVQPAYREFHLIFRVG